MAQNQIYLKGCADTIEAIKSIGEQYWDLSPTKGLQDLDILCSSVWIDILEKNNLQNRDTNEICAENRISIRDCQDLTSGLYHRLQKAGIEYLNELEDIDIYERMKWINYGPVSEKRLQRVCEKNNVKIKMG